MIYIVVGPTGSGKTSAAIKLASHFDCPIINADAFQIYQDMNIGTAKINKDDPFYKRHYLLDIKRPSESFSVMEYQRLFREKIQELQQKYDNIVVCGGTGLYIRAAIYDYEFKEEQPVDTSDLEKMDNDQLYELLKQLDPKATEKIHPNNRKRVIRAITIARSGELNKSELEDQQEHKLIYKDVKILMISPDRELLYDNINRRVDKMFEKGLVEEVKELLNNYKLSSTASAAIGYKEVIDYLEGKLSLDDCKELIKKRTRNYAKRQVTFFKNKFDLETYQSSEELVKAVIGE